MRKFTNEQKEYFKQLVLDCAIQRLTTQESLAYIKDNGIEIGESHFNHIRAAEAWRKEENWILYERQVWYTRKYISIE